MMIRMMLNITMRANICSIAMTNIKQSRLMKWFVEFLSGLDCTRPTQMSTACDHNGSFMMHHHDHSAWSQWLTMTPYGPSDLSWSYWSYDYSSWFHIHLRPLYFHHPNDHHSLGCISLKRRPAVEGWYDDMLPTAPVLRVIAFNEVLPLTSTHFMARFCGKTIQCIFADLFNMFWDVCLMCFLCWSLCFFIVRGAGPPQPFWSG